MSVRMLVSWVYQWFLSVLPGGFNSPACLYLCASQQSKPLIGLFPQARPLRFSSLQVVGLLILWDSSTYMPLWHYLSTIKLEKYIFSNLPYSLHKYQQPCATRPVSSWAKYGQCNTPSLSSGDERRTVRGVVIPFKLAGCLIAQSGMHI